MAKDNCGILPMTIWANIITKINNYGCGETIYTKIGSKLREKRAMIIIVGKVKLIKVTYKLKSPFIDCVPKDEYLLKRGI